MFLHCWHWPDKYYIIKAAEDHAKQPIYDTQNITQKLQLLAAVELPKTPIYDMMQCTRQNCDSWPNERPNHQLKRPLDCVHFSLHNSSTICLHELAIFP
jgi:hypothetical protein